MAKDIATLALMHEALQDRVAEVERLARGWRRGWITIQRLKRRDEGRPPMEIMKD